MDPKANEFVPLKDSNTRRDGTPLTKIEREWTKFQVGEPVILKEIEFEITEIGTNRLILKPIKKWN